MSCFAVVRFYLLFDEKILFLLRNIAAAFAFSLLFFCIACELDLQGKVFLGTRVESRTV